MSQLAHLVLSTAIDALSSRDATRARSVLEMDDRLDEACASLVPRLLGLMRDDSEQVERGVQLQAMVKWLERVGDHASNLVEQVIFTIQGTDVRHPASSAPDAPPSSAAEPNRAVTRSSPTSSRT
jgi:phosphate transport system protein